MSNSEQEEKRKLFSSKWHVLRDFLPGMFLISGAYLENAALLAVGTFLFGSVLYWACDEDGLVKYGGEHGHHH